LTTANSPKKTTKKRRRTRSKAKRTETEAAASEEAAVEESSEAASSGDGGETAGTDEATTAAKPTRRRRSRRGKRSRGGADGADSTSDGDVADAKAAKAAEPEGEDQPAGADDNAVEDKPARKRRSRRGGKRARSSAAAKKTAEASEAASDAAAKDTEAEAKPARSRRGGSRRTKKAAEAPVTKLSELPDGEKRLMVVNVAERDECRIAILHRGRLEELFMERVSAASHVGNIYKGRVTNVEPSIQAAFIDFGLPKHGFLHISDLQPQYFPDRRAEPEQVGRKTPRRDRPPIQKCLRRNQEVIVQITKEGIGTKGPTLTTYISLPGRYIVMMPGMDHLGVSRKIEDLETRRSMRDTLNQLELPKGMGYILRTAGQDKSRRELQRDLNYLQRLWKAVAHRIKHEPAPCELYQESDLVIRTIRDVFSSDFAKIIVDDGETADKIKDFLSIVAPRTSSPVDHYDGREPLFHRYGIEAEIEKIHSRHVPLPLGGSLVIDSAEALVAIDVNSGKYRSEDDAEETAYKINLEAADEIARQLLLRDLGGLIICDFIDLRFEKHRRGVERALRDGLKQHKERAKVLRMSQFGIIEITRQRTRPSINRSVYQDCPHCKGSGLVKTTESMSLEVARLLRVAGSRDAVNTIDIRVSPDVAFHLQNRYRALLYEFEQESGRRVIVSAQGGFAVDQVEFVCRDQRGGLVPFDVPGRPPH